MGRWAGEGQIKGSVKGSFQEKSDVRIEVGVGVRVKSCASDDFYCI